MRRTFRKIASLLLFTMVLTLMPGYLRQEIKAGYTDANNGDWSLQRVELKNTKEAQLMVRVGDIDNLGYGWKNDKGITIDPFSGAETSVHGYPSNPRNNYQGTDKVMVVSGYKAKNPSVDGYTEAVYNKNYSVGGSPYTGGSAVEPIKLTYNLGNIKVKNARIQMFVDDIQPSKFKVVNNQIINNGRGGFSQNSYNEYEVYFWIEGNEEQKVRVSEFEEIINNLDQHGPIGKLISFDVPEQYLNLIQSGEKGFYIKIDDVDEKTTGYVTKKVYVWNQSTYKRKDDELKFKQFFEEYYAKYSGQNFIQDFKKQFKTDVKNYFKTKYGNSYANNYETYFKQWFSKTTDQYVDTYVKQNGTTVVTQEIYATGDGYAIDFVKLLINRLDGSTTYDATVKGKVYEAYYVGNELKFDYSKPAISGVNISFNSGQKVVQSNENGEFYCDGIPAGQAIITATKDGYAIGKFTIQTLLSGEEKVFDIGLVRTDTPLKPTISLDNYSPTNMPVTVSVDYPGTIKYKKYRINGGAWKDYTGPFQVTENCLIEAKSIKEIQVSSSEVKQFESEIAKYQVTNIDKSKPPAPTLTRNTPAPVNTSVTVNITYPQGQVVKEVQIKRGGNWEQFGQNSIPSSFEVNENMIVYAKYKNDYGNWSDEAQLNVDNIDRIPPTATLTYETVDGASYNPANWTNKNVKAILTNFDSQDVTVTIKNSSVVPQTTTGPSGKTVSYIFDVPDGTEATPSITFVLRDLAGNQTEIAANAKIDKILPSATVTMKTTDGALYDPSKWTNKNIVFEFSAFDSIDTTVSLAGVESGKFITDNNGGNRIVRYTTEYGNVDNAYNLDFMLTDKAGNTVPISRTVKVDRIAPTITVTTAVHPTDKKIKVVTATASELVTFTTPSTTDTPVLSIEYESSKAEEVSFQCYDKAGNIGAEATKVDMLHRER